MVPTSPRRVAIALIVLSIALPVHAQSPVPRLPAPGPIAASAARLAVEQSTTIQRGPRSRVRRSSCAQTMLMGTGIGAGIGLGLGVAGWKSFEDQPEVMLATTGFVGLIGFAIGYRMCG
jgi:ABC-type nitrate/sulfonate/bicarbonate transport system permease component